jgi:DNA invertase Pin-like site-specific DNA recombinase
MTTDTSHALAYLRTSSAANVGGDSDVRQRIAIEGYAKLHGLDLVGEFYDAAVSGADPVETRPGFAKMLDRIEGNGVRLVIVEDASRFARDLVAQELGVLLMQSRGVRVVTSNGDDLTNTTDPARIMMRQVAGAFAQYEKARLVGKLRAARDRKSAAAGKRIEGQKGFAGHRPEIYSELSIIHAANPDAPMRVLSDRLAAAGYLTSTGKTFAPNQIARLLSRMP